MRLGLVLLRPRANLLGRVGAARTLLQPVALLGDGDGVELGPERAARLPVCILYERCKRDKLSLRIDT